MGAVISKWHYAVDARVSSGYVGPGSNAFSAIMPLCGLLGSPFNSLRVHKGLGALPWLRLWESAMGICITWESLIYLFFHNEECLLALSQTWLAALLSFPFMPQRFLVTSMLNFSVLP